MTFLQNLDWRYAAKEFDTGKKISPENLEQILHAIHMAPSSYGLQSYHITVVRDEAMKQKLAKVGFGQKQFETADTILVFSARTDILKRRDAFLASLKENGAPASAINRLKQIIFVVNFWLKASMKAKGWAAKQAYIALGFGLAAAAELQIDSCPLEGFVPRAFKHTLKLQGNMYPVVALALGYRKEDASLHPKFRFPKEDMFDYQ